MATKNDVYLDSLSHALKVLKPNESDRYPQEVVTESEKLLRETFDLDENLYGLPLVQECVRIIAESIKKEIKDLRNDVNDYYRDKNKKNAAYIQGYNPKPNEQEQAKNSERLEEIKEKMKKLDQLVEFTSQFSPTIYPKGGAEFANLESLILIIAMSAKIMFGVGVGVAIGIVTCFKLGKEGNTLALKEGSRNGVSRMWSSARQAIDQYRIASYQQSVNDFTGVFHDAQCDKTFSNFILRLKEHITTTMPDTSKQENMGAIVAPLLDVVARDEKVLKNDALNKKLQVVTNGLDSGFKKASLCLNQYTKFLSPQKPKENELVVSVRDPGRPDDTYNQLKRVLRALKKEKSVGNSSAEMLFYNLHKETESCELNASKEGSNFLDVNIIKIKKPANPNDPCIAEMNASPPYSDLALVLSKFKEKNLVLEVGNCPSIEVLKKLSASKVNFTLTADAATKLKEKYFKDEDIKTIESALKPLHNSYKPNM